MGSGVASVEADDGKQQVLAWASVDTYMLTGLYSYIAHVHAATPVIRVISTLPREPTNSRAVITYHVDT
jgi:hypothetical protein